MNLTAANTSDSIAFSGSSGPTLDGYLSLVNINSTALAVGQTYQLFNYASGAPTGSFLAPIANGLPALPAGEDYSTAQLYTAGTISIVNTSSGNWISSGSNNWETPAAWDINAVPGGVGTTETFGDSIGSGSATVTLTADETAGDPSERGGSPF